MRRFLPLLLACALLIALALPAAAELSVSGSLSNESRVRLLQNDMPEGYDFDLMMLMSHADFILRATDQERRARLFMNVDLRHDPTGVFDETDDLELRLREAYGGFYTQYVSFEVGKRIFSWGMADEFNPTDLLNPEDMRWVVTFDKAQRKLGVYSGNLTLSYGDFSLQGVYAPVFEPTLLPAADSDWLPWQLGLFYGVIDAFPDYVDFQERHTPDMDLSNSNRAARFRGLVGPVDFSLVWFDGFDPLPVFNAKIDMDVNGILQGSKPLMIREAYQRYQAYGGSMAFTAGSFSFRGEGAYYTDRQYNNGLDPSLLLIDSVVEAFPALLGLRDFQWHSESPSYSAVGGVDWREGTTIYANVQYAHTQILDYDSENIYEEFEGLVTGKLQTMWLEEDLEVGFDSAYNVFHADWFAKPYVAYNFTVDLRTELGVRVFGGDPETQLGNFDDNDFGYLNVRYNF